MPSAFPGGIDSLPDITNPTVTDCNLPPTLSTRLNLLQEAMTAVETWLATFSPNWTPPAGLVQAYAGATAPSGYLLCQGQAVSRTTFQALFNAIGTTYGTGDGATTFGIPDLRGLVVLGVSPSFALASTGGEYTHQLISTELAAHTHSITDKTHVHQVINAFGPTVMGLQSGGSTFFIPAQVQTSATATGITATNVSGSNVAHNNTQPYMALNWVIKV